MAKKAVDLLKTHLDDAHMALFGHRLAEWLIADLNQSEESVPDFTESRAKALLRAAGVVDDPTLHDFARLVENNETAVRIALFDLLNETELAEDDEVTALAAASGATGEETTTHHQSPISWLSLVIAAHAWKSGYPLYQLDPASPPGEYSPAGQLVKRAATFLRQQVQRSATERDKLGRKLAYDPGDGAPDLGNLPAEQPIAPLPPHFRAPIPVRYPEVARDTVQVDPDEADEPETTVRRNPPITITDEDLPDENQPPLRMPPITISREQVQRETQTSNRQTRPPAQPSTSSGTSLATAVRQRFSRDREPLRSTKLRVTVREVQDGPGLYGVQVRVRCKGINAYVAGATNRDGIFLCELPVRAASGLTYDVDVTWPRDFDGEIERKSITLNADRTQFTLPFYRHVRRED